jgi:hypothetical protein
VLITKEIGYTIFKSKYLVDDNYIFPQIENERKCLRKWLDKYEWAVYSIKESAVFCKYFAIFAKLLPKKRNLINQPKNKGCKGSTAEFNKHSTSIYKINS